MNDNTKIVLIELFDTLEFRYKDIITIASCSRPDLSELDGPPYGITLEERTHYSFSIADIELNPLRYLNTFYNLEQFRGFYKWDNLSLLRQLILHLRKYILQNMVNENRSIGKEVKLNNPLLFKWTPRNKSQS